MKKIIKYLIFTFLLILPTLKVNAATGLIDIYASSKNVKVGNTTTVTVYCKTTGSYIGTCEYTLSYDTSKLKLTSGDLSVMDVASSASSYQLKRTYTFKVIATGSSKVTVKSYAIRTFSEENELKTTVSPVTITGTNETSTPVTYSTNNNLKSLEVTNYKLDFNKDTLEYKLELEESVEEIEIKATTEDSKAKVAGTGKVKVSLGANKIDIVVTSEKGTKKTYTIIATVKDSNPININIDDKEYTVVKRESTLTKPENFESTKVTINNEEIPAFYNELNNITLIGLKDNAGNINLYIYDEENNTYKIYNEVTFNNIKLLILEPNKEIKNYIKTNITIGDTEVTGYKLDKDSKYTLIYGTNLETSLTDWYTYEEDENTIQKYTDEVKTYYENEINNYKKLILILGGLSLLLAILALISCTVKPKKKKNNKKEKKIKDTKLLDNL